MHQTPKGISSGGWLAALLMMAIACGGDSGTTGRLVLINESNSTDSDECRFEFSIRNENGNPMRQGELTPCESQSFELKPGVYTVDQEWSSGPCTGSGGSSNDERVAADDTTEVSFSCANCSSCPSGEGTPTTSPAPSPTPTETPLLRIVGISGRC